MLNNNQTYGRDGFYIHGGYSAGSLGCIDLWKNNDAFFNALEKYSKELNITQIPLIVKYKNVVIECEERFGYINECKRQ